MDFQREFIEIGQVQIRYYGIIIVFGMLMATMVAANIAQRTRRDPEHVYGALTWAIIPGIIGARLWFVLFPPELLVQAGQDRAFYLENFFDLDNGAIAIWSGGLSIFGAVIGGLLGAYIYLRRNNLPIAEWLDIGAIVLPLGQAIGRWANYVNQELFGTPISQEWLQWIGLEIPRSVVEGIVIDGEAVYGGIQYFNAVFHPIFLYESLWSIGAFIVLLWLFNTRRDDFRNGDFFLLYIAQYSVIRFLLEFIRVEVTLLPGSDLNLAQIVCVVTFLLSTGLFFARRMGTPSEGYTITPMKAPPKQEESGQTQPAT